MIAAIVDIVASRELSKKERQEVDEMLRQLLTTVDERFEEYMLAESSLTQGDSMELLVSHWLPLVFLFHSLLKNEMEFRVGIGTGDLTLRKESADECDGPVFWHARDALEQIKQKKYMSRTAGFVFDDESKKDEINNVIQSILFLTTFLGQTTVQLQHCYLYLWEGMNISEIASEVSTSKANVSKSLSKTPCYLIQRVIEYLVNDH